MDKLVPIEATASLDNYSFDYLYLREAIDYLRKHDPKIKGASLAALAAHAGLAESTFKKLLAGNIEDPRSSTLWLLCIAFELDPRRLMKLPAASSAISPGRESEVVEDLRRQLRVCEEQKRTDDAEMARLRRLLLDESVAKAQAVTRADGLAQQVASLEGVATRHRTELRRHRWSMLAIVILVLVVLSGTFFV